MGATRTAHPVTKDIKVHRADEGKGVALESSRIMMLDCHKLATALGTKIQVNKQRASKSLRWC